MKLTCDKNILTAAINTVSRATASKSPIPALEGILIEADNNGVKLTGFDLKKGIYTTISSDVVEEGSVVIGARILGEIVKSMPSGEICISTENNLNVKVTGDSSEFNIIGIDANDFPELPSFDVESAVTLPADILGQMIRQTLFAVSDNESRPVYTGELFEIEDGNLTIVAIDGYRMALRREKIEGIRENFSFIVPGKTLSDLEKLCSETEKPVIISLGSNHISFALENTVLISRRLEGDFMNYRKTVPAAFAVTVSSEKDSFARSIERVSLIIDDKVKNPVKCLFGDDCVKMSCATALGNAEDICPVDGNGQNIEIGFNNRYLLEALKAISDKEIKICLNSGSAPCIILPNDESEKFIYMILPVRLKAGV